ncbi:alpha-1,2-fucosyltransferase [Kistimonas asteriae]|uniref:alpha-1,2-fucosyltransferase n=1 Tax=Kistimonas asteriae TaxID=517724 RepID=UPI001BA61587|nr:alpha-1,2-fucosyltransferase [Kistimonas asteriae]
MIIAKPVGGLANQMGVYAAAKALATHHNVTLKVDVSDCSEGTLTEFRLKHLNIKTDIATHHEIQEVIGLSDYPWFNSIKKKLKKKFGLNTWGEYKEHSLTFDPDFFNLPGKQYLKGNFPSIVYYEPIKSVLQAEFTVKSQGTLETRNWEDKIRNTRDSVCLHIRRGDYTDPKVQAYHGLLDLSYYEKAMSYMASNLDAPELFVFSDEIDWVKAHLNTELPVHYVDCHSPYDGHLDFHLMQQCHHFIIANSGFSRWPAYLSDYSDKIVCMPKVWCVDDKFSDSDIAPDSWVRL